MRFTSAVALAAATAPIAVSARGKFGYSIGVRHPDASCKTRADFDADFKTLKGAEGHENNPVSIVRTYAINDGAVEPICEVPSAILPAAKDNGLQVLLGLWADNDDTFEKEMNAVLDIEEEYRDTIYAFTVGSEGLYRNEVWRKDKKGPEVGYTADELLKKIRTFKDMVKGWGKKVGTADVYTVYEDGTADNLIDAGVDLLLVNGFPYWQSANLTDAAYVYLEDLRRAYSHIQGKAKSVTSIELWNGETGWPTGSDNYAEKGDGKGIAEAGVKNAQTYFSEAVCAALDWNFNAFYFSAFSEPWKPKSEGKDGNLHDEKNWGAFNAQREQVIMDLSCSYKGKEAKAASAPQVVL